MGFQWVAQWDFQADFVAVATALTLACNDAIVFEIGYDPLHGPLGYANIGRYVPQAHLWIAIQTIEHMRVIR